MPPSKRSSSKRSRSLPEQDSTQRSTSGETGAVSAEVSRVQAGAGVTPAGAATINTAMGNSFVQSMIGGGAPGGEAAGAGGPADSAAVGGMLYRKAASMAATQADSALSSAAQSSGRPLDKGVRGRMEAGFGQDFSDVRVHTDGAAQRAAGDLNANAFTQGSNIYFNKGQYDPGSQSGQHLLAHELAHVAQGAGAAAKASGEGPSVSSPGDAAEHAADRAADAVVRGESAGDVGGAPAAVISRDAISDLRETSEGNWLGDVDEAGALEQIAAMSPAERSSLWQDESNHPILERLAGAFNAAEMLQLFMYLSDMDLRWQIYWSGRAGVDDDYSEEQWRWLIGYATPQELESLRDYPDGYRRFLRSAPADLVPAWDLLQGWKAGHIEPDEQAVRNAVNQLNVDQQAAVRDDFQLMWKIVNGCGDAREVFRTIAYLDVPIKWAVFYLDCAGVIDEIEDQEWAQLLAEGDPQEFAELVGWQAMWDLAQANIPASIMQLVRQNDGEDGSIDATLDDPVQLQLLLSSMGAAGFLALATQPGSDIPGNYAKIKAANQVMPVLNGLNVGPKLGDRTAANLRTWFFDAGETDIPTLEKMMTVRFRVQTGGTGSKNHETSYDPTTGGSKPSGKDIAPWTLNGLVLAWTVMERLPPTAVEQNPSFLHNLRNRNAGNGNAYYSHGSWDGNKKASEGDVVMGYRDNQDATLGSQQVSTNNLIYQAGAQEPGSAQVSVLKFNATLRHEIGHAVDDALGVMDGWMGQREAGGWIQYDSYEEFVDAIINAGGGLDGHGYPAADVGVYRQAMIRAVSQTQDFNTALQAVKPGAAAAPDTGPVAAVFTTGRWTGGGSGPWYQDNNYRPQGGRNFQRSYGSSSSLYSFLAAERSRRMVTKYQWRAPGEWFAEAYQVYYAEQEQGGNVPVGGILRAKDPEAANMIANICDRGFSPQDMRGSGTAAPTAGQGGVGGGTVTTGPATSGPT